MFLWQKLAQDHLYVSVTRGGHYTSEYLYVSDTKGGHKWTF